MLVFWLAAILIVLGLLWIARSADQPKKPARSVLRAVRFGEVQHHSQLESRYLRGLHSKIHGVSYRQEAVRKCSSGDALFCLREPQNPADPNAIAVHRLLCQTANPLIGEQLGYLSRDLAEEFAPKLDAQRLLIFPHITEVTGSLHQNLGVNILIELYAGENYGKRLPKARATGF